MKRLGAPHRTNDDEFSFPCDDSYYHISDEECTERLQKLQKTPSIKILKIAVDYIDFRQDGLATALLEVLQRNNSVQKVLIYGGSPTHSQIKIEILSNILQCPSVELIEFADLNPTRYYENETYFQESASYLQSTSTLKTMIFSNYSMNFFDKIVTALEKNNSLTTLGVKYINQQVIKLLDVNPNISNLIVGDISLREMIMLLNKDNQRYIHLTTSLLGGNNDVINLLNFMKSNFNFIVSLNLTDISMNVNDLQFSSIDTKKFNLNVKHVVDFFLERNIILQPKFHYLLNGKTRDCLYHLMKILTFYCCSTDLRKKIIQHYYQILEYDICTNYNVKEPNSRITM